MGYLYDSLKKALGGKMSTSASAVINNWSPNEVRALFIGKDFILVAHHIKRPSLYVLDMNLVIQDLAYNGSTGALHNLLSQRQLSCMEEIYVDSIFKNYLGLFNMEGYISRLLNDRSRLRYYGYFQSISGADIYERYNKVSLNGDVMYSYAGDTGRGKMLQFFSVGNSTWYKNYNLRPSRYSMDSEKGNLARWFRNTEKSIEVYISEEKSAKLRENTEFLIAELFKQDLENLDVLVKLLNFKKVFSNNRDIIFRKVCDLITENILNGEVAMEIYSKDLVSALSNSGIEAGNKEKYLLGVYGNLGILPTSSRELDLELMVDLAEKHNGFICLKDKLDGLCCKLYERVKGSYGNIMNLMVLEEIGEVIPKGKFFDMAYVGSSPYRGSSLDGYLCYILGVCGLSEDSFSKILKEVNG